MAVRFLIFFKKIAWRFFLFTMFYLKCYTYQLTPNYLFISIFPIFTIVLHTVNGKVVDFFCLTQDPGIHNELIVLVYAMIISFESEFVKYYQTLPFRILQGRFS